MTSLIRMAAFVAALMTVTGSARAATRIPTHVACVGDSITQGVGASSGNTNYPADLQALFGSSVQVKNFGHSGATMLSVGDLPYQQQSEYASATTFVSGAGSAAIVDIIIMLGTNDSKPFNWTVGTSTRAAQFRTDCAAMVDHFAQLPTHPLVYLALPPHAYANSYQISGTVIHDQILPILREVAAAKGIPIVDVDAPTTGHPELFPDGVHPNDAGYKIIAQTMHDGLLASVDGTGGSGAGGSGGGGAGGAAGAGGGAGGAAGRGSGGGPAGGAAGVGHGGSSGAGGSSSGSADAAIAPGGGGNPAGSTGSGGSASGGFAGSVGGSGSGGAASTATGGAAGIGAGGSGGASGSMGGAAGIGAGGSGGASGSLGGAAGIGAGGSGGAAPGSTGGTAGVAAGGIGGSASHPTAGASPVTGGGAAGNGGGDSSRGCSCAVSAPNEGRRSGWPLLLLVGGALALACRARWAAPSASRDCRVFASGRNSNTSSSFRTRRNPR
jgi:lysophospholipase L1-like esterase